MNPGQLVAERFEIERFAGAGGMGSVYRARDRFSGHAVALKVLRDPGALEAERFVREAEALQSLSHPAIVRFIAHGQTGGGAPYLALEWIDGESLAERLARAGLTVAESLSLGARVAEALGAAHRRGIVHRDIKPSNLLLVGGRAEEVKLVDFGIARLGGRDRSLTQTGVMLGTPGYMAPEQARGEKNVDARADVFSLGCVLFKCLTGRRPFEADDLMATLLKLVLEEPPPLRELCAEAPAALEDLLARMLAKAPAERPVDGAEVAQAIAAIERREGGPAAPASAATAALTTTERPVMCVVLARTPEASDDEPTQPDVTVAMPDGRRRSLGSALDAHGAGLAVLADRSMLITVRSSGAFTDQAARAARAALEVRSRYPGAEIAVVAGRGDLSARLPIGAVIDRAVELVRRSRPGVIRVDEVIAGLVGAAFELGGDEGGLHLVGERREGGKRTLLGRPTPFVGRERELSLLGSIFDEVLSEPVARAVLVTAPAGVGKSALRLELLRRLREKSAADGDERPFELWLGRGDPMRAGSPFGLIAPALRTFAGVLDGEPIEVRRQKLRAAAGRGLAGKDQARVAIFLGELCGVPFPDEESVELAAARRDAILMGDQMRRAFEDFVAATCASAPQVLVLEDLQWGDRASLQLIDGALRNLHDRPLLVLAFGRPEVAELFPALWAGRAVIALELSHLPRKASEKLVRKVLGDGADAATVERIVALSGGDAFYLEELIRAVAEGQDGALPETVLAMVQQRLDGLDTERRRVLRAASIFGRVFWSGGVTALLGGDERTPAVSERLDDLAQRELVQRLPVAKFPGQDEYAFRHSLVREAAYAMLTDKDRRLGHRLAGEWLERAGESDAAMIGEHFERGGEPARAFAAYRRAAAQALEGNDLREAVAWADRARRSAEPGGVSGEEIGALHLIQAEALRWQDALGLAEPHATEAKALLPAGSEPWFAAAAELCAVASRLGLGDRLIGLGEELCDRWSPEAGPEQVSATATAATALVRRAEYALADELLTRVRAIEPLIADPLARAKIHQAVAMRALVRGDAGLHLTCSEAAAALYAEAGDRRNASLARITLGFGHTDLGDFAPAERALREALSLAEPMGLPSLTAYAKHTLGITLGRSGAHAEAQALEEDAAASFAAHGDARLAGGSRAYLAVILRWAGDLEAAEREATRAVEGLAAAPPVRAYALAARARIRVDRGRPAEALAYAREAFEMLTALGGIEEGEALVRLGYAEALMASGEDEEARAVLAKARARLLERAERLGDEAARDRFLTRVEENARTLSLAATAKRR